MSPDDLCCGSAKTPAKQDNKTVWHQTKVKFLIILCGTFNFAQIFFREILTKTMSFRNIFDLEFMVLSLTFSFFQTFQALFGTINCFLSLRSLSRRNKVLIFNAKSSRLCLFLTFHSDDYTETDVILNNAECFSSRYNNKIKFA